MSEAPGGAVHWRSTLLALVDDADTLAIASSLGGGLTSGGFGNRISLRGTRFRFINNGSEVGVHKGDYLDVVLLAGKGHEQYQVIGNEQLPFDDAAVAREALARRRTTRVFETWQRSTTDSHSNGRFTISKRACRSWRPKRKRASPLKKTSGRSGASWPN
jgi:hypothetical protein